MGPLEGIKILDLSLYGPGRYCFMNESGTNCAGMTFWSHDGLDCLLLLIMM
jgi:hypothetical protein